MSKPLVIRQIAAHCAHKRVTPFRLRTADAERLLAYVEELERNQHETLAEKVARIPKSPTQTLEPEERVLSEMTA